MACQAAASASCVEAANAAAIRAYEKAGFRPVGVMRRYERDTGGGGWHDGLLMELLAGVA